MPDIKDVCVAALSHWALMRLTFEAVLIPKLIPLAHSRKCWER